MTPLGRAMLEAECLSFTEAKDALASLRRLRPLLTSERDVADWTIQMRALGWYLAKVRAG